MWEDHSSKTSAFPFEESLRASSAMRSVTMSSTESARPEDVLAFPSPGWLGDRTMDVSAGASRWNSKERSVEVTLFRGSLFTTHYRQSSRHRPDGCQACATRLTRHVCPRGPRRRAVPTPCRRGSPAPTRAWSGETSRPSVSPRALAADRAAASSAYGRREPAPCRRGERC